MAELSRFSDKQISTLLGQQGPIDDDEIARRARTTTAGADIGLLTVVTDTAELAMQCLVSVVDDGGEPLLLVPFQSQLWENASSGGQWASLLLKPNESYGVGLNLGGRLHPVTQPDRCPPAGHAFLALRVERILASCPNVAGAHGHLPVSVLRYATAEPDLFAANLPRVIRHINSCHREQLRNWAARHCELAVSEIAGATLGTVHAEGAVIWVVTGDGARTHEVTFGKRAETIDAIRVAMTTLLGAA